MEGEDARAALDEERRATTPRGDVARHRSFAKVSPAVGQLDESGFESAVDDDADEALSLLAELVRVSDRALREQARRLAGKVLLDRARVGASVARGVERMRTVPADRPGADLDVDRSLDALLVAGAERRRPALDELSARAWGRPALAVCLVVDRSGSMHGDKLVAAALAAAACAWRAPEDHAVLAFAQSVLAVRSMDRWRPPADVVDDVLSLRGKGTTDLKAALDAAREQLDRSRATRKLTVLLSDCRVSDGPDPVASALALDELLVLGHTSDGAESVAFARRVGARCALVAGPSEVPGAMDELLR